MVFLRNENREKEKISRELCTNYVCIVNYVDFETVFLCTFPLDFCHKKEDNSKDRGRKTALCTKKFLSVWEEYK